MNTQEIEAILAAKRQELETQIQAERALLERKVLLDETKEKLVNIEAQLKALYESTVAPLMAERDQLKSTLRDLLGKEPRKARTPKADITNLVGKVFDELAQCTTNGVPVSCATVAQSANLDAKLVSQALKALVQEGKVETVGQRRGMLYTVK